jgi:hypothetical protein
MDQLFYIQAGQGTTNDATRCITTRAYGIWSAITQGPPGQMYTDGSMQTPYNPPQNQRSSSNEFE